MPIKSMTGDLLRQDDVDAIVNTVNCVGVMRVLLCNSRRERLTRARRGPRAADRSLGLALGALPCRALRLGPPE